jgi:minor histocompatibility antigen H13
MADTVVEAVQQAAENITENANVKVPASPEGMAIAYGSLVIMALLPIFFGSKRSVSHQKEQKESSEKPDIMTKKDAMMFPVSFTAKLNGDPSFSHTKFLNFRSLHLALCLAFIYFLSYSPRSI